MSWARQLMLLATASLVATGALAMNRAEYNTAKQRIGVDAKVRLAKCRTLSAHAKEICTKEARGAALIARADLDAIYKPSDPAAYKARVVRADAAYAVTRAKCGDLAGQTREVCRMDAKGVHVRAVEDAKVALVESRPGDTVVAKNVAVAQARKDAATARRKADFDAAKARCGALAPDLQAKCVEDAKRVYAP